MVLQDHRYGRNVPSLAVAKLARQRLQRHMIFPIPMLSIRWGRFTEDRLTTRGFYVGAGLLLTAAVVVLLMVRIGASAAAEEDEASASVHIG